MLEFGGQESKGFMYAEADGHTGWRRQPLVNSSRQRTIGSLGKLFLEDISFHIFCFLKFVVAFPLV
ncbi:hypothetical protein N7532_006746 [Penicillium argentinense]|uniref:Uncharacterized protein n=1 Tax=Penicillium argentinense TaxID=1131581 RepID=A0A9W9FGN1_9EURO|nr:uncharacterized protein N7532_006746 [Penicillium argentinense]KAJ5099745.1 hypothetical protein N7532_006746 [Penicillium argentinense]